jgi:hypothetical protein
VHGVASRDAVLVDEQVVPVQIIEEPAQGDDCSSYGRLLRWASSPAFEPELPMCEEPIDIRRAQLPRWPRPEPVGEGAQREGVLQSSRRCPSAPAQELVVGGNKHIYERGVRAMGDPILRNDHSIANK